MVEQVFTTFSTVMAYFQASWMLIDTSCVDMAVVVHVAASIAPHMPKSIGLRSEYKGGHNSLPQKDIPFEPRWFSNHLWVLPDPGTFTPFCWKAMLHHHISP